MSMLRDRRLQNLVLAAAVFVLLALVLVSQVLARQMDEPEATISLTNTPSPPTAIRPGEAELIHWEILATTTPVSVSFEIVDLENATLVERQVYPGATGLSITRSFTLPLTYTLPYGRLFERYRIRVEYYSLQAGNEAGVDALFWVTQDTGDLVVHKFDDRNGNGVQDAGDDDVPNVPFQVRIQGQTLGDLTDANGNIFWRHVPIGTYTVTELVPAGYVPTTPDQVTVTVTANTTHTLEFGNRLIPGALEALVFEDSNGDGVQDGGEPPFPGITVSFLSPCGDDDSGVTGGNGLVSWSERCVGDYTVNVAVPAGYAPTTPPSVTTTVTSGVTATVAFGLQGRGALTACKFEDRDGNGQQDPEDGPLAGVRLSYAGEYGNSGSGTTDATGCVTWSDLPAGAYEVTEDLPANCQVTTQPYPATASVVAGQTAQANLGNRCFSTLVAKSWDDLDGDGVWSGAEPALAGVTVSWINEYGDGDQQITDASGVLTWTVQPVGTYTVTASTLPDYTATTPFTQTKMLVVGVVSEALFGQRQEVSCVDGYKVDDFHVGLPGWIIRGQLADGTGPIVETSTDGTGYFRFDELPLGVYRFWEVQQVGWAAVTLPEFQVPVLEPGDSCVRIRFKNKQATPVPPPPDGPRHFLPLAMKRAADPGRTGRMVPELWNPLEPTPQGAGCVVGRKVDDLQVGLPGWTIHLENPAGLHRVTQTDGLGQFRFDGVPAGDYTIREDGQVGWAPMGPTAISITVDPGEPCRVVEFRNRQATPTPTNTPTPTPTATPQLGCIDGYKVDDLHVGLPGWVIRTQLANGTGPIYTDVTDGTGRYTFGSLPFGLYRVWEEMQPGWSPVTPPEFEVTVAGSQCVTTRFKNRQAATPTPTPTPPPSLIDGIPHPKGIAANSQTNRIYVASKTTGALYTVNGDTHLVEGSVAVGQEPFGVAVNAVTNRVYVANYLDGTLSVIDGGSGLVVSTIDFVPLGFGRPSYVAVNEAINRVYVTLHDGGRVAVINGATNALITTVPSEAGTFGIALHPGLQRAYVGNRDTGSVTILDTATNLPLYAQKLMPGGMPYAVAVDAGRNRLFVLYALAGGNPDRVAVFSTAASGASRIGTVLVADGGPAGGTGMAVNPVTGHVFVANSAADSVTVFDGVSQALLDTVAVGDDPGMVGVNPATGRVYVSNRGDDTVQVIQDSYARRTRRR